MKFVLSDGVSIPVPPKTIDLAFSDQLLEHLHPDDAVEHLQNVYEALKPGGHYFCSTPNRLRGPCDVSRYFDTIATGFHLKEYTYGEVETMFRDIGFRRLRAVVGIPRCHLRCRVGLVRSVENAIGTLPGRLGHWLARQRHLLIDPMLLNVRLVAEKQARPCKQRRTSNYRTGDGKVRHEVARLC